VVKKREYLFDEEDEKPHALDEQNGDHHHDSDPARLRSHSAILVDEKVRALWSGVLYTGAASRSCWSVNCCDVFL
jgi:hypothetical protein